MKVINGLENLEEQNERSAVTVGVFDGVHKGHKAVVESMVKSSKEKSLQSAVITFDPHPLDVLKPRKIPTVLTALPLKLKLLEELGVELTVVIRFDKNFADMGAEDFVGGILLRKLKMKELFVGERFHLGSKRSGDIDTLKKLSQQLSFDLHVINHVDDTEGHRISSTHIRNLIHEGKLKEAKGALGRYPTFIGKVEPGDGRGGLIGFHTANVVTQDKASIPRSGVYAGKVATNSHWLPAVINIGSSPTFNVDKNRIEAHIIDFNEQIYGKNISVILIKKIRDIEKFNKPEDLARRIKEDIAYAKQVIS